MELLKSTGLLTIKVPKLEPLEKDTFRWYSNAPDVTRSDLTWVLDGSALNSKWHTLATYGFGIVVISNVGDLVAWGGGRPPAWVDSASAAEAWALATATSLSPWEPRIITDCVGLLRTAELGEKAATKGSRQLARTWTVIAGHLAHDLNAMVRDKRLRWMPAHQGIGAIGVALKSDGRPITALEWRANRLVDAIAKLEATRGMAPEGTISLLNSAAALVRHTAAQMGTATHLANNHVVEVQLDCGKTVHKTIRDAQEPPKKQIPKKSSGKVEVQVIAQPPEEISDWESEDERKQYGLDDKRARRAQQKKLRLAKEEGAVNRVVAENAARAGTRPCYARTDAAVTSLVDAARGGGAGQADSSGAEAPTCSVTSSFLQSVPNAPPRSCRSRPEKANLHGGTRASIDALREKEHSCTRATNEAVQSLLGAQHFRRNVKEAPKRKELKD